MGGEVRGLWIQRLESVTKGIGCETLSAGCVKSHFPLGFFATARYGLSSSWATSQFTGLNSDVLYLNLCSNM